MRSIFLIARREYLEQIRGRAFRLSTIGLPLLFVVLIGIGYLSSLGLGANKRITVATDNTALANDISARLLEEKEGKPIVEVVSPVKPGDRDALIERLRTKDIDGLLMVETPQGAAPSATYYSKSAGDFVGNAKMKGVLNDSLVDQHLLTGGMKPSDADAVVKGISVATFQVKKDGKIVKSNAQASFWKGYIMAFLLSMTTLIYGMNVARSIIQEKTSRIFEVMLAISKPSDMLAGKLIGVGAVGLTQIIIWLVSGAAILGSALAAPLLTGEFEIHFSWTEGILFPVYFVLGYLLYSSLFAGLAATCETEQELQMYTPLAAAPTWLSFMLIILVMNDSNSFWSVAVSLFPPTAPIIMFLRMASEIPPYWQFAVSIGLMILSIWGVVWVSSRLYRVGILMYGKRATLPELMRWIRYS
jgi:ABC-2 type transport system permease protein